MASTGGIEEALARYLAACESRDLDAILACFADAAEIEDPTRRGIRGRAQIRGYFAGLYDDLASLSLRTGPLYLCHEKAACQWRGLAVRRDGREIAYEGIDVFAFDGAMKIVRLSAFWDPKDFTA